MRLKQQAGVFENRTARKFILSICLLFFSLAGDAEGFSILRGEIFSKFDSGGTTASILSSFVRLNKTDSLSKLSAQQIDAINSCMAHARKTKYTSGRIWWIDAAFKVYDDKESHYIILTPSYGLIDISENTQYALSEEDHMRLNEIILEHKIIHRGHYMPEFQLWCSKYPDHYLIFQDSIFHYESFGGKKNAIYVCEDRLVKESDGCYKGRVDLLSRDGSGWTLRRTDRPSKDVLYRRATPKEYEGWQHLVNWRMMVEFEKEIEHKDLFNETQRKQIMSPLFKEIDSLSVLDYQKKLDSLGNIYGMR